LATAEALARLGASIYIACRNKEKTLAAIENIKKQCVNSNQVIEYLPLDLSNMSSVKQCVQQFKALNIPLHVLINNAGIATYTQEDNETHMEKMFVTNPGTICID